MTLIPMFPADHEGAFVFPCHVANCYNPLNHGGVPNKPKAFILHTPEEPADNYPGTPHWFQNPAANGSTIYFVSFTGDVYQCLPESWGAIANGLNGKPRPAWADAGSLNWQTLNVEIEGYARNIENTMKIGGPQWNALVKLVRARCAAYKIPLDRTHIMGHYELSIDRTDPGAGFPWAAFIDAIQPEEDELKPFLVWCDQEKAAYIVGPTGAKPIYDRKDYDAFAKAYGPPTLTLTSAGVRALQ